MPIDKPRRCNKYIYGFSRPILGDVNWSFLIRNSPAIDIVAVTTSTASTQIDDA